MDDVLCRDEIRVTWIPGPLSLSSRVRPDDSIHNGHVVGMFFHNQCKANGMSFNAGIK